MHCAPFVSAFLFALSKEDDILRRLSRCTSPPPRRQTIVSRRSSSSTSLNEIAPVSNKHEALLDWLSCRDAEISNKITIRPSERGGGYGAFLTAPVEPDELLFTVPRDACITLADDALNDPECGAEFQKLIETAGPGGNTVALAGFIAKERLKMLSNDDDDDDKSSSKYGPYLETLPWERGGDNNQEHILFWSDEEIETKLKGSMCYGEAVDLRKEVALAIRVLDRIIGNKSQVGDSSGFQLPWERDETPPKPIEGLPEAVKAAFVCLLTRSFQDDDSDDEKLVPLLDMLQHSDEPNVSHVMRKDDGTVVVRARRSMKEGEELLNQYRDELEENMPYHRFFTRFGFVPGIQEPIEHLLEDKSSIFFAQKAEV